MVEAGVPPTTESFKRLAQRPSATQIDAGSKELRKFQADAEKFLQDFQRAAEID